jgi:nitrogen fixation protein NifU and related proteins
MTTTGPYGSTIAEHFRRPRNQGALPAADASAERNNPLCGDRVRLAIALDTTRETIAQARFIANACAICVASASLLTERLQGLSLVAAEGISAADVLSALAAEIPVARKRCATLPFEALREVLASVETRGGQPRSDRSATP